jgi:hypothetical protein
VKRRVGASAFEDIEEIKRLTLEQIKKEPRWKLIWMLFNEKKKMFPELPDEILLEQLKQQIIMIRQLSRMGLI